MPHTGGKFMEETRNGQVCKCMDCARARQERRDAMGGKRTYAPDPKVKPKGGKS